MLKAQKIRLVALIGLICIMLFMSVTSVFATDLDNLGGGSSEPATTESSSQSGEGTGLMDYMSDYNPLTDENMQEANKLAGPLATVIGNITGVILVIVSALIFLITAIDLVYIAVPFSRKFLNPNLGTGQQASGGGMPMGGGYGMRGGYGMGAMGGMGAGAQAAPSGIGGHCWVSDEAIAAVSLAGGNQQAQPGMGAMGMGNPMAGMAQQGPQAQPTKSVIVTYLKKRMVFVVVFVICTIVLFSSVLTDCGINLAQLLMNLLEKFNASF